MYIYVTTTFFTLYFWDLSIIFWFVNCILRNKIKTFNLCVCHMHLSFFVKTKNISELKLRFKLKTGRDRSKKVLKFLWLHYMTTPFRLPTVPGHSHVRMHHWPHPSSPRMLPLTSHHNILTTDTIRPRVRVRGGQDTCPRFMSPQVRSARMKVEKM